MKRSHAPVPYDSWIQRVCPSPRRHFQRLLVELGCRKAVDLGCGGNSTLSPLRRLGLWCVGVDASGVVLREARSRDLFDEYVCRDALDWLRNEAASRRLWEVIVASHVIEHLERESGEEFLRLIESVSPRLTYIETPYGFVEPGHYQGDPLQVHRSAWFPWDFAARGYTVFGMGMRGLRGSRSRARLGMEFLTRSLERAIAWFSYPRPSWGSTIAAIRYVDGEGCLRRV